MLTYLAFGTVVIHGGTADIGIGFAGDYERVVIPRVDSRIKPRQHGSMDSSRYYEGQTFSIGGFVKGSTTLQETSLDLIRGAVALTPAGFTLGLQRQGVAYSEQALVKCRAFDEPRELHSRYKQAWSVELFSADPRLYSGSVTTGSSPVTNGGNYPTPPVLTVAGNGGVPVLTNSTTGEVVTFAKALAGGNTAVLDVAARSLKVNGIQDSSYLDAAQTSWFELVAGANTVSLSGAASLTIAFRNANI